MRQVLLAFCLSVAAFAAFALPTATEVQAEVAKGHYAQAEQMMSEVVAAKPSSARAHYVYAEILAHDRQFDQAAQQARLAQSLDPQISFTQPEKFRSFARMLAQEQAGAARAGAPVTAAPLGAALPQPRSGGIPGWVWALGLMAVMALIWKIVSSRRQAVVSPGYGPGFNNGMAIPGPMGGYPPGGGYAPGYQAPSAGSGLLGTGLAAAGGVAAGMLVERLIEGHSGSGYAPAAAPGLQDAGPGWPGGGSEAAVQQELEDRPVDFGSGDDSWGGGDPGSSGGDGGW